MIGSVWRRDHAKLWDAVIVRTEPIDKNSTLSPFRFDKGSPEEPELFPRPFRLLPMVRTGESNLLPA
jgi:hypothetical protein